MNEQGEWSLSPAYDLVFSAGPGGEHTMTIAGEDRQPTRQDILKVASQFDIKPTAASQIVDEVNSAIGRWNDFAGRAGCMKKTMRAIGEKLGPL